MSLKINIVMDFCGFFTSQPAGHVLAVTHAGVIRVILCRLMGLPLKDLFKIRPDYGQLAVLSYPADRI